LVNRKRIQHQRKKIIPAENPNGRIQYRSGTHHSGPERSNSTASSHSIQSTLDTKKARENFERIVKQLEKSKSDLDRQRAKGPNHNPTKLAAIEQQIRQYEQQLNDIRRRLTVIDPSMDTTGVRIRDENATARINSFLENRTSTYGEPTNAFSTNNDEGNSSQDTHEPDDEASEIPSKATVTSFDDIFQLVNTTNWSPLTVFLNFLLTDPAHEPNCLLFYTFTEELRTRKAESRNEYFRWVFELHSTFTMNGSPLHIGLPQARTDSINRCLENQQSETNEEIKSILNDAKDFARSVIMDRQLTDFNQKRTTGAVRDVDCSSIAKPHHFIEETLRSKFESFYKPNIEDWNSTKNSKELALVCSLATYFKRCDIKKCGNIPLDKIPKFFDREQRRLLVKLPRAPLAKKIKDHQLTEHQFSSPTLCQVCTKALWGIQYQGYLCTYCQQAFHRECASNSEKCLKDRKSNTLTNPISGKQRKVLKNPSSPTRTIVVGEETEGNFQNDPNANVSSGNEGNDLAGGQNLSTQDQNKNAHLGRCASDRRAAPNRIPAKYRSNSETDESDDGNPQMGGNSIDELLSRSDNETGANGDSNNAEFNPIDFNVNTDTTTEGDSDLEADVNSLPNLSDFIPADVLQALYQSREWKLQTTINELIHTERTHLKGLKIMKKCFKEPMENGQCMNSAELHCIFRNLDELIDLHSQFKYALRQHRDEAKDHVVRHIGDLILKFLDGEKGEQFACACAYFIEDQSQALKLIKKKEQSTDFASLMRACESNPLCRRLTLKDYLPSVMTRFTKLKMLCEAMKKFVADDEVESEKLSKCVDRADYILKRMNHARLKKEQEALLKQIKANLEIQIPNADKSINLQNLQDCLEVSNNRLLYSGTLKLLPELPTVRTEFECCLFTDIFVFFQKIVLQPSEQRGIEDSYRYVLKEHQRDANNGRTTRPRTAISVTKFTAPQNFILTPIIRLEHLLIKKKACGGARSFYVIDTDKKQLIEVEANSKDELEKWLEWIEKARIPFEKPKAFTSLSSEKSLNPSISSQSTTSLSSLATSRSVPIESQSNASSLIETNSLKIIEKQSSIDENPESLMDAILEKDKELSRVLQEKEMLLARLLNIPPSQLKDSPGFNKPNSSLEAITFASSCHNQLIQLIGQTQNYAAKEKKNATIDVQSLWTPLTQLGEQLNLALKLCNQRKSVDQLSDRRNSNSSSSALTLTPSLLTNTSQTYSELKDSVSMSSLHSAESLGSVMIPLPMANEVSSSITDLDETIKSPISTTKSPSSTTPTTTTTPTRQLHVAREVIERYDEGVFDDGTTSQNDDDETNSVIIADSDEDEIEHFDSTDSITVAIDPNSTRMQTCLDNSNNLSIEGQSMSLDVYEDEIYDNVKSNDSSRTNNPDNTNGSRHASEA